MEKLTIGALHFLIYIRSHHRFRSLGVLSGMELYARLYNRGLGWAWSLLWKDYYLYLEWAISVTCGTLISLCIRMYCNLSFFFNKFEYHDKWAKSFIDIARNFDGITTHCYVWDFRFLIWILPIYDKLWG